MSFELWDEVFDVNVRGAFGCCRAAIPVMRGQGEGVIINIGSVTAYCARSHDRLAYACSKGALLTMTKTLARSLLPDRIRVNWITVGWVATEGERALRDKSHGDAKAYLAEQAARSPLGRLETVEEVAAGVVYLAGDEASHATGCELNISGGRWI
jgi:NAD(P)-dependent dehydrogenase (short-subunit alcohol dehydrogenase family)